MKSSKKNPNRKPTEAARGKPSKSTNVSLPPTEAEIFPANSRNVSSARSSSTAAHIGSNIKQTLDKDCEGFDNDDEEEVIFKETKYSRRSVVSNWNRYEEPQVCEETLGDSMTGEEHGILNSRITAGGVTSQFRFRDELEWEEDSDFPSDFQKLNLEDLAFSLSCIPLHERLDIEAGVFQADLITEFQDSAHANRQIYHKQENRKPVARPAGAGVSEPSSCSSKTDNQPMSMSVISADHGKLNKEVVKMETIAVKSTSPEESDLDVQLTPCETFEDELDILLAISAKSKSDDGLLPINILTPSPISNTPGVLETVVPAANSEFQLHKQSLDDDWLDDLLND